MNDFEINEVIDLYSDSIYRLAFSMVKNKSDADDIYQEVFLKYIKYGKSFHDEHYRKAWLYKVTVNCCKKLYASAWRRKTTPLLEEHMAGSYEDNHDELLDIIEKLPLKYKTVIHLFYYESMSVEEIARLTKQKKSTVRTQLTRARKILKERLEEE